MNAKQTVPLAVALAPVIAAAPPVILGVAVVWLIKRLLESVDEKQPEIARKNADNCISSEIPTIPPASLRALSPPSAAIIPAPVHPVSSFSAYVRPVATIIPVTLAATIPPAAKKTISRADLAAIFDNGKRSLSRISAVAELKRRGIGKSAAYSALSPAGRFSAWLDVAPDGIISWTDGRGANSTIW